MVSSDTTYLTMVVPVKNEAENIEALADEVTSVFGRTPWAWECIWVDDGSTDNSLNLLEQLAESDQRHRYISFEQSAGQWAALWAGFQAGRGEILATIDGDGQNDPADIPRFVKIVASGQADMVTGYRERREDTFVRRLSSRIANAFRNWVTGESVRDAGCSTRAFKKECVRHVPLISGMQVFLPTLVAIQGYRLVEAPAHHRPRRNGESKYNIRNRLWDGLINCFGVLWLKKRSIDSKRITR